MYIVSNSNFGKFLVKKWQNHQKNRPKVHKVGGGCPYRPGGLYVFKNRPGTQDQSKEARQPGWVGQASWKN